MEKPDLEFVYFCFECGERCVESSHGSAHHLTKEDKIDYDLDADHVAVPDIEK